MRILAAVLLVLAACGGKPTPTTTPIRNEPPPGGEDKQPEPPADDVCASRPESFGPVTLDEAQAKRRYGANAKAFTDAPSTKERPIEVCGIPASRQWLRGTACADGSAPKQNGRSGNVGTGGRCGSIIDLYSVTCPEGDYEVYIDIYMCGPGESMM